MTARTSSKQLARISYLKASSDISRLQMAVRTSSEQLAGISYLKVSSDISRLQMAARTSSERLAGISYLKVSSDISRLQMAARTSSEQLAGTERPRQLSTGCEKASSHRGESATHDNTRLTLGRIIEHVSHVMGETVLGVKSNMM